MRVASRSRRRNEDLLKGGLDSIGHHALDLEERERNLDRATEQPTPRTRRLGQRVFLSRCVVENPIASVAIVAGVGVLVGCVLGRLSK